MASDRNELRQRFRDVVTTEEELRAVLGRPKQRTVDKVVTSLDETSRRFIARSPFLLISSVMESGLVDVSPKGDPAGFVRVLDDTTLAIPDRLGNRRGDTMVNILRNPNVGLIFLIPGVTHTLRVSGKASIVRDTELRETLCLRRQAPRSRHRRGGRACAGALPEVHDALRPLAAGHLGRSGRGTDPRRDPRRPREARDPGRRDAGDHRRGRADAALLSLPRNAVLDLLPVT